MSERYRHKKRGTTYTFVGGAKTQTATPIVEGAVVAVYRSDDDGTLWARPWPEFYDGRFERLPDDDEPEIKSEMLARVVRAMRAAEDTEGDAYWAMARAAIEELRKPTEEMSEHGAVLLADGRLTIADTKANARRVWRAMIDAALAEQEPQRDALGEYRDTPEPP